MNMSIQSGSVASFPQGHLFGLTLSNNAGDATNDIDFAAGSARDSTNAQNLVLSAGLTKQLDAAWAAGSAAGGRMSAAAIANTTYHCFIIGKADGTTDVGFDTSATAPTLPTGYTTFRRIGSIMRVSGSIVAFKQYGDRFGRDVPIEDVNSTNPGTAAITQTLSIPTGVNFDALVNGFVFNGATATARSLLITALEQTDTAPTASIYTSRAPAVANALAPFFVQVKTNTSAQVRSRVSTSDANTILSIVTVGWVDTRGRLA